MNKELQRLHLLVEKMKEVIEWSEPKGIGEDRLWFQNIEQKESSREEKTQNQN